MYSFFLQFHNVHKICRFEGGFTRWPKKFEFIELTEFHYIAKQVIQSETHAVSSIFQKIYQEIR